MAARTFTDSAGLTWEVFEVQRASRNPGAVSAGLERGWLAFASGEHKRRLAPFPPDWASASDIELAALCESARRAPAPRYPLHEPVRPRIRRSVPPAAEPRAAEPRGADARPDTRADGVQAAVRTFAREARTRGLPAVAAMLELKTLLLERYPEADSEARDWKLVRRWFVEAYYFDRGS